jgi:hypothetical protein
MPNRDKLVLAKAHLKPGRLGDSQYAKNLCGIFWEPNVLENRSVTGKSSNAVKGVPPKPQLTPHKLDIVKRKLLFHYNLLLYVYKCDLNLFWT